VVRLAATREDFVHAVAEALAASSPEAIETRVAVARQNSWDQRVAEISRILGALLHGEDA
jgi:hypothetical protein